MTRSLALFPRLILLLPLRCLSGIAQQRQPEVTIHASSNLVLVDVIALRGSTQRPDSTLGRDDFQVYDNGRQVSHPAG